VKDYFNLDDLNKALDNIALPNADVSNRYISSMPESDIEIGDSSLDLHFDCLNSQKSMFQFKSSSKISNFFEDNNKPCKLSVSSYQKNKNNDVDDFLTQMQNFHISSNEANYKDQDLFHNTSSDDIIKNKKNPQLYKYQSDIDIDVNILGKDEITLRDKNEEKQFLNIQQRNFTPKNNKYNFKKVKFTSPSMKINDISINDNHNHFVGIKNNLGLIDYQAVENLFKELSINVLDKRILTSLNAHMIEDMARLMYIIKNNNCNILSDKESKNSINKIRTKMKFKRLKPNHSGSILKKKHRKLKYQLNLYNKNSRMKVFKFNSDSEDSFDSKELSFERQNSGNRISDSKGYELVFTILDSLFEKQSFDPSVFIELTQQTWSNLIELIKKKFVVNEQYLILGLRKNKRRNEEQCKFVFKKAMKRLFKLFKAKNNYFIKGNKILDEIEFYNYYFKSTAEFLGEPIQLFYLPGCKLQIQTTKQNVDKTISYAYMKRVFSSESFKQDFVHYLVEYFVEEYKKTRNEKIDKIREKIFTDNFKVKSVKLPWTNEELAEAQNTLLNIINGRDGI